MKWSIIMNVWDYKMLYMRMHVCIKIVKMDGWTIYNICSATLSDLELAAGVACYAYSII